LKGAEFFRQRPNFFVDRAEKFGQELATLIFTLSVPIVFNEEGEIADVHVRQFSGGSSTALFVSINSIS
jgi:hypothetical protein